MLSLRENAGCKHDIEPSGQHVQRIINTGTAKASRDAYHVRQACPREKICQVPAQCLSRMRVCSGWVFYPIPLLGYSGWVRSLGLLSVSGAGIAGRLLQPPYVYPLTFRGSFRNYLVFLDCLTILVCHRYYSLFCPRFFYSLRPNRVLLRRYAVRPPDGNGSP